MNRVGARRLHGEKMDAGWVFSAGGGSSQSLSISSKGGSWTTSLFANCEGKQDRKQRSASVARTARGNTGEWRLSPSSTKVAWQKRGPQHMVDDNTELLREQTLWYIVKEKERSSVGRR